jgi:hypothetical protein
MMVGRGAAACGDTMVGGGAACDAALIVLGGEVARVVTLLMIAQEVIACLVRETNQEYQ